MTVSSVGSTPPVSFTGLESGLNTEQIISAYLQVDEAPMEELENQQSTVNAKVTAYQQLQTQVQALEQAGDQLAAPNAFASAVQATSSNSAVATATTGNAAAPGSTTFSVVQLATTDTLVSSGSVASTSDVVANGDLLVAAGGGALGISSLAGSGLTTGAHTIAVTQASSGAAVTGATLGQTTTISAGSDQLTVTLGLAGQTTTQTFDLADGTYTASQLAAEIGTASGGALVGSIDSSGRLVVTSADQGSQATLQIGAGSANSTLGLTANASASGTDGVITVDGTANTVQAIASDGSTVATLTSGSGGTVSAQLAGTGLVAGSLSAQNVSTGNGSLASVVGAINAAGAGVSAQALQVGANAYALELSATATGAANDVSISPSSFAASSLGTLETSTAGQDAIVSLGGPGGYEVHSSSNTFSSLLPGVDVQLQSAASSAPVTISVSPDGTAAASMVQSFVNAANTVLSTIATDTAYDATTNTAGPLNGDESLSMLTQQILSTVGSAIGNSSAVDLGTAGSAAGLTLGLDTINFDAGTFASDFDANPSAVAKLFTQAGSFTPATGSPAAPGDVSLVYAGNGTQPGTYAVSLSTSAAQATDTGSAVFGTGGTVAQGASYTVSSGGTDATFAVQAGQTLADVASGLDSAFAAAGLQLSAQVVASQSGSALQITSAAYGSAASFGVTSSGGDPLGIASSGTFTGTDVAGSINGVTATGAGQVLSAPASDPTLAGLALQVETSGVSSPVQIGSYDYTPGIAQALAAISSAALANGGQIPATIASLKATSTALGSQISVEQQIVVQQQQALTQEYTNLEETLASLKSESSFLTQTFGSSSSSSLLSQLGSGSSSSSSSTSS